MQDDQLLRWLKLPTAREQRRFLEDHCTLLDRESDMLLSDLLKQIPEDPEQRQQMRDALILRQDARRRGGTAEAIREAYINVHGGFVLDPPLWMEAFEERLIDLREHHEETAEACVELLQGALEQALGDASSAPELVATLRLELADAWYKHQHTDRARTREAVIYLSEEILHVYTLSRYPHQYAKVQNGLGNTYYERMAGEREENLERAIACYEEALRVWTLDAFPFYYAGTQNSLGIAWMGRMAGERRENLERALTCYEEALRVYTGGFSSPSA